MQSQDERNLELLGNLHFVLGGVTALLSCIPFIHFFIGLLFLIPGIGAPELAPRLVGLIFVLLSGFIIVAGWVMAVLIIVAGSRMKQRRYYNFCLVVSFLECLIVPLGTVLGIITIVNLTKDSVKELFA